MISTDLRNSIYLWAGAIICFGLFWAGLHFDVFAGVPGTWLQWGLLTVGVVNIGQFLWGLWRRRASGDDRT